MTLSIDLIARLIRYRHGSELPVMDEIRDLDRIADGLKVVEDLLRHEERRHKEALIDLQSRKENLRGKCGHPLVTHYPDPAGGSDSFSRCDVCGLDFP